MWFQLIEHAKLQQKPIILVTRDMKEDWWLEYKGKTLMPRPELRREFRDKTKQDIYFYRAPQFIAFANENLKDKLSEKLLDETQNISDVENQKLRPQATETLNSYLAKIFAVWAENVNSSSATTSALRSALASLSTSTPDRRLVEIAERLHEINERLAFLSEGKSEDEGVRNQIGALRMECLRLGLERDRLRKETESPTEDSSDEDSEDDSGADTSG